MKYIIEGAGLSKNGLDEKKSILIENSKVTYCNTHFSKYSYFKVNVEKFHILPGYVMIDFDVVKLADFQQFKERMKQLHTIGCTTLITACEVSFESQFSSNLRKAKQALINSSIDYVVAVKIPLRKLTATFIRKCCKSKVPIVFLEITRIEDIYSVHWQRIRDELFHYHCYIVPLWNLDVTAGNIKTLKSDWTEHLTDNKIATQSTSPLEHTPIKKQFLLNAGLYPQKGALNAGSDADYLLFLKERGKLVDTEAYLDQELPDVVCATGKIQKAGREVIFEPGYGKELQINLPRKFVPISQAFKPQSITVDYY